MAQGNCWVDGDGHWDDDSSIWEFPNIGNPSIVA